MSVFTMFWVSIRPVINPICLVMYLCHKRGNNLFMYVSFTYFSYTVNHRLYHVLLILRTELAGK